MSIYFSYFPTTQHDLTNIGQKVGVTNILRRFKVRSKFLTDTSFYNKYQIQSGERPDTVADKIYGDPNYAWLVLLFNNIDDPIFGWPLFNKDFDDFIVGKYGSIATAKGTVQEYRKILTSKSSKFDGSFVDERYVVVDATTYATLGESVRQSISQYDYEDELNEEKRKIKLLQSRYLSSIRDEVKSIVRDGV